MNDLSDAKIQKERRKLYRKAVENLKDYNVSVSLKDSEKFLDGWGGAVVTLENKTNQKKSCRGI